ncbi:VCBS repeat-containing protein, partial [Puniceibacterium sp. HSS470]
MALTARRRRARLALARLTLTRLIWTCLTLVGLAAPLRAEGVIEAATYAEPTRRYDHGVLGDDVEWGALVLTLPGRQITLRLPETRVFEDTQPRLADLDGDGAPEVITVESDLALGARLSVYGPSGLVAATPF